MRALIPIPTIPTIPTIPIIGRGVRILMFRETGSESGKEGKGRKMARGGFFGLLEGNLDLLPSFLLRR
jgi:hypothetical protein